MYILFSVHYRDLNVYVGMHDRLDTTYITMQVVNGIKHPQFTSNAVRDINDIAVLTLDRKLRFSDKVRPICLPDDSKWHWDNNNAIVEINFGSSMPLFTCVEQVLTACMSVIAINVAYKYFQLYRLAKFT